MGRRRSGGLELPGLDRPERAARGTEASKRERRPSPLRSLKARSGQAAPLTYGDERAALFLAGWAKGRKSEEDEIKNTCGDLRAQPCGAQTGGNRKSGSGPPRRAEAQAVSDPRRGLQPVPAGQRDSQRQRLSLDPPIHPRVWSESPPRGG